MTTKRNGPKATRMARLASLLFVAVSCGGEVTGPGLADLAGEWSATSAVMTNPARPDESVDLIQIGLSYRLVIDTDGSLDAIVTANGTSEIESGTIALTGDRVTVTLPGSRFEGTFAISGDVLTLDLRSGVAWDFDGDTLEEPATLVLTLGRVV